MTAQASVDMDNDSFEILLYTSACWPTKTYSPIKPARVTIGDNGVTVLAGSGNNDLACYSNFQSDFFSDITNNSENGAKAFYEADKLEREVGAIAEVTGFEIDEDAQISVIDEDGSSQPIPKSECATVVDISGVFAGDEVTFHGNPAETHIRTTVENIYGLIEATDLNSMVDRYPIQVYDGEFRGEVPIGSADASHMMEDTGITLVWDNFDAEVSGVDTLNFYGDSLKRTIHCLSRWVDDDAEIELHTSPYSREYPGQQEGLAVVYRGEEFYLGYVVPPEEPTGSVRSWVAHEMFS